MPGKKSTQAEIKQRRERGVDYIIEYLPNFTQFIRWHQEAFSKGRSTAQDDWQKCLLMVAEEGKMSTDAKRWRRIMQLEKQYKDAEEGKEKANIVMQMAKLEGLETIKQEITANIKADKPLFNINIDEVQKLHKDEVDSNKNIQEASHSE